MFWKLIEKEGETPIPPYIKNTTLSESELRKRYQSVLARERASVAAPTASLHFTEKLIAELAKNGTRHTEVTLHVGLGTFAPIDERNIAEKKLFTEYFEVTEKAGGGDQRGEDVGCSRHCRRYHCNAHTRVLSTKKRCTLHEGLDNSLHPPSA